VAEGYWRGGLRKLEPSRRRSCVQKAAGRVCRKKEVEASTQKGNVEKGLTKEAEEFGVEERALQHDKNRRKGKLSTRTTKEKKDKIRDMRSKRGRYQFDLREKNWNPRE